MKSLIVYYSSSGNTKFIAQSIADELKADIAELEPKKQLNATGAGYVYWGLRQLLVRNDRKVKPLPKNISNYDLIIIGTPVWSFTMTPPIRNFLKNNSFSGKKVALFCCDGEQKGKTFENMLSLIENADIVGKSDYQEPLKGNPEKSKEKALSWAHSL